MFKERVPVESKRYAPEIVSWEPVEVAVPAIPIEVPKYPVLQRSQLLGSPTSK